MDPSQPIDESGPVGPFTEAPDEPPPAAEPITPVGNDVTDTPSDNKIADTDTTPSSADADTDTTPTGTAGAVEHLEAGEAADPTGTAETAQQDESGDTVDLDAIAADLADVERAMERLEAATYWTDEVTGAPLDDDFLAEHPTARRSGPTAPPPAQ